jgi:hypothetical protein
MVRGSDHVDPRCTSPAAPQSTIAPRCRATTALPRRVAIAETRRPDPPDPALHHPKRRLVSPAAREPEDVLTISQPACRSRLQTAQSRSRLAASDRIVLAIIGGTSFAKPGRGCTARNVTSVPPSAGVSSKDSSDRTEPAIAWSPILDPVTSSSAAGPVPHRRVETRHFGWL